VVARGSQIGERLDTAARVLDGGLVQEELAQHEVVRAAVSRPACRSRSASHALVRTSPGCAVRWMPKP
jgi:hypothetical protein